MILQYFNKIKKHFSVSQVNAYTNIIINTIFNNIFKK